MTHVTCRLTAKNRDQLRNPTFCNRVWATFTFLPTRKGVYPRSDQTESSTGLGAESDMYDCFVTEWKAICRVRLSVHSSVSKIKLICDLRCVLCMGHHHRRARRAMKVEVIGQGVKAKCMRGLHVAYIYCGGLQILVDGSSSRFPL